SSDIALNQRAILEELIVDYSDIFANPHKPVGIFNLDLELKINLKNDEPIRCKPYRLSEPDKKILNDQINTWIELGVCRISDSSWAAPAFVVEQPFHESTPKRVVVDYSRTINKQIIPDSHPIENMDDVIVKIAGKRYISRFDIKSAFLHIPVRETDIHKTAFVTPDGHYEFQRMPFGLANGPSVMCRAVK